MKFYFKYVIIHPLMWDLSYGYDLFIFIVWGLIVLTIFNICNEVGRLLGSEFLFGCGADNQ